MCRFDVSKAGSLGLEDLKRLMESLGAPQTHLALKAMVREADRDGDGRVDLREFLALFRLAAAGAFDGQVDAAGLAELAALGSVDVREEGVLGARDFFEAKVRALLL